MLALSVVPAVVQFIGFIFLPESPRWLLQKGQSQEARDVLSRIRGDQSIDVEYETIKTSIEEEEREAGGGERSHWQHSNKKSMKVYRMELQPFHHLARLEDPVILRILRHGPTRRALMVGCGLQMFQQLSGINTVMYVTHRFQSSLAAIPGLRLGLTAPPRSSSPAPLSPGTTVPPFCRWRASGMTDWPFG